MIETRRGIAVVALSMGVALGGCGGFGSPSPEGPSDAAAAPVLVALVSVGGLTTQQILAPPGETRVAMPQLAALAAAGVVADRVETIAPATPLPVHATLVSGRWPAHHGVTGELPLTSRGVSLAMAASAAVPRGRTLWTAASGQALRVAALGWPGTSAAATQLFAHFPPASGASAERWQRELVENTTPGLLAAARNAGAESPEASVESAARDHVVIDLACSLVERADPPQLLLARLGGPMPALVRDGPGSRAAQSAFATVDGEIERLRRCLARGPLRGRVALFVVGDTAFASLHSVISPNAVLAEAGLVVPAPNATVQRWSAFARPSGALALVHARTEEDAMLARRALEAAARSSDGFRIVGADELIARGADPEAWFGLEARPGFGFSLAIAGPLLRPSADRGVAGYLDPPGGVTPAFVASGAGIRSALRYPVLRQIDVAPTIARLLDLSLGDADGRPLVGALVAGATSVRVEPAAPAPAESSEELP